jgi:hypothetical protein
MMRPLLILGCAGAMMGAAQAMNWEGHDDWMRELPAAKELQSSGNKAPRPADRPAKARTCMRRDEVGRVPANPYETVPPLCAERSPPRK